MIKNEYGKLREVILHKPQQKELNSVSAEVAMYATVKTPDYYKVLQEFNEYVLLLESLDVKVWVDDIDHDYICPNNIFMRDIGAVIGDTLIIGKPAYDIRKHEVDNFKKYLAASGLQSQYKILQLNGKCKFEGADLFVIDNKEVVVAVGNRTNIQAYDRLKQYFSRQGWNFSIVNALPEGIPQHLLGGKHIVSKDTIISRTHLNGNTVHKSFKNSITLTEDSEVVNGYACNVVTIGPNEIVMPSGNPMTKRFYEAKGLKVHETPTQEISMMAGSLACMTLPIRRD